jgi:hypothetical protein
MKPSKVLFAVLALAIALHVPLDAQSAASLAGVVTSPAGSPVANATISVTNTATGHSSQAQTDAAGLYTVQGLTPGAYTVSVSAHGYAQKTVPVTLNGPGPQRLDLALSIGPAEPALGDLGFSPEQTQGNAEEQARLNKRSHMLKVHQELGLITLAPMLASLFSSTGAGGRHSTASGRALHAALGSVTAGMYITTASFAIFAPKVPGTKPRGPIRFHRAMAWIHGPGMILTPLLGSLADEQRSQGQKVHGIAQAHGAVAIVTAAAYGLAMLSVTLKKF